MYYICTIKNKKMIELKGKYNKDCKIFVDDMEESCYPLVQEILDSKASDGVSVRIMPDCLTNNTEVLTDNGFKLLSDLDYNDKIANYNPADKTIFFNNPLNIISRDVRKNEKIYQYTFDNKPLYSVSENHRLALRTDMECVAKDIQSFKFKDLITFANLEHHSECIHSDNFLSLLVWVVGDGSYAFSNNDKTVRVRFDVKKRRKIERLKYLLDILNIKFHTHTNGVISLSVDDSRPIFEILGKEKILPFSFCFFNSDKTSVILNELIQVDGDYESFKNNRGYRLNTSKHKEADMFQIMMFLHGYHSVCKYRETQTTYGTAKMFYVNKTNEDKFFKNRNGRPNKKTHRSEIDYKDKLYCVTCDTSFFVVRQNGYIFVTGNCHAGKGIVIGFTMPITDMVNPNHVGVDIGCGLITAKTKGIAHLLKQFNSETEVLQYIDHRIRKGIPMGMNYHTKTQGSLDYRVLNSRVQSFYQKWLNKYENYGCPTINENYVTDLIKRIGINTDTFYKSIGTLGGGETIAIRIG